MELTEKFINYGRQITAGKLGRVYGGVWLVLEIESLT